MAQARTDVIVVGGPRDSVVLFRPLNARAKQFILDNTDPENRQFLGDSIAVEWRYVTSFAEALGEEGFVVRGLGRGL